MMEGADGKLSRAHVIGITGPIRSGKSRTTGSLIRVLHEPIFRRLVEENRALLSSSEYKVGSSLRHGLKKLWTSLTPEQRLILCFDPWNKCEKLKLSSIGLSSWKRNWADDAFQLISQDNYLGGDKKKQMVKDIRKAVAKVDADPSLSKFIIVEGFWLLEQQFLPHEVLPLLDTLVVLHASKEMILQRDPKGSSSANKAAWDHECGPYLQELCRMFPWMCPPHRTIDRSQDGVWHRVIDVTCRSKHHSSQVSGLNFHVAQFSAAGSPGLHGDTESQVCSIVDRIVLHLASHASLDKEKSLGLIAPQIQPAPQSQPSRRQRAYLVNHGSFNPPHRGHIETFCAAKRLLEQRGYEMVFGVMAPTKESHIKRKGAYALPLDSRVLCCQLIADEFNAGWIRCDRKGVEYNSGGSMIRKHFHSRNRDAIGFTIMGADVAQRYPPQSNAVVVARSGSKFTQGNSSKRIYVTQGDASVSNFSSSALRKAWSAGEEAEMVRLAGARVTEVLASLPKPSKKRKR